MSLDYNDQIARHYNAFRPPLHKVILADCLGAGTRFENGLDIGSGTGQSAIALSEFCHQVTGAEPSEDMLKRAISHPAVNYVSFDGKCLPFSDNSFDIITFAGSLFYAKSQQMLNEVIRVAVPQATVVVYDFEILFDRLGLDYELPAESDNYNHAIDFSGLNTSRLSELKGWTKEHQQQVSAEEAAHLLLSSPNFYQFFSDTFATGDPFGPLVNHVSRLGGALELHARRYCKVYTVAK